MQIVDDTLFYALKFSAKKVLFTLEKSISLNHALEVIDFFNPTLSVKAHGQLIHNLSVLVNSSIPQIIPFLI
jgi:hypothetical protein